MKIVIGHKNLNLEELYQVASFPSLAEVIVDSVTAAEFAQSVPGGAPKDGQAVPQEPETQRPAHGRAVLLVKLL